MIALRRIVNSVRLIGAYKDVGNAKLTIRTSNLAELILKLAIALVVGAIAYLDVMFWLCLVLMIVICNSIFVLIVEVVAIPHSPVLILVSDVKPKDKIMPFYLLV